MNSVPRSRSSRREATWTVVGFTVLFAGFLVALEVRFPQWTDREYAARRDRVIECREQHPERPLLVVIGGSRVGTGFVPEEMESLHDQNGQRVSVVNFSHLGAGPRMNLVQLHRLLRDGIRPKWVVVEMVPAHLCSEVTAIADLSFSDVRKLRPHWDDKRLLINPVKVRATALLRYRNGFLDSVAPAFATGPAIHLNQYGGNPRWLELSPRATEDKPDLIREIRWQYEDRMAHWTIDRQLDGAMQEILHVCREKGMQTAITLFPETTEFRSWYGAGVEKRIQTYFDELCEEYAVACFDCREWMDDDAFHDPHHMRPEGAKRFSKRFGQQVLSRIVQGRGDVALAPREFRP